MKYLIALLTIALATLAQADSLQAKVDALSAAPGVLEAWIDTAPVSFGKAGTLYAGRVAWVEVSNGTVQQRGIEVIVQHLGVVGQETAYWVGSLPAPLQVTPADPLGTDKEILTAVGGKIVKAEITRHPVVGDVPPSATVYGYREVDGTPVEFKVVVYSKGGVLVSNDPTEKATVSAEVKAP